MKYAPRKVYIKENNVYVELSYIDFCRRRQADQSYKDKLFIPVQGCLLEVVREQYMDFYRDKERWRYLKKLDTNHSLLSLEGFTDKLCLITGRTDMRLSVNGLMSILRDHYQMDPYANTLYLFCGRKTDRLKALYHDKNGFVLLYMRLDSGRFQWPRNASEARMLTRQEYRWLMEGLSIDQPRALRPSQKRDF